MTRRNRTAVDILEDHERAIKRLRQALARSGGGGGGAFLKTDGTNDLEGTGNAFGFSIIGTDAVGVFGLADFMLADSTSGDFWMLSHRGQESEIGDLGFFFWDDSAATWSEWLNFDLSDDKINVTKDLYIDHPSGVDNSIGLTIWNEHASGYGVIEIGGKSGAIIDFKLLEATDFDIRFILQGNDLLEFQGGTLGIVLDGGESQIWMEGGTTGTWWGGKLEFRRNEDLKIWSVGMRGANDSSHENDYLIEEYDGTGYSSWMKFHVHSSVMDFAPGGTSKPLTLNSVGKFELHGTSNEFKIYSRDNDDQAWILYNPTGADLAFYQGGTHYLFSSSRLEMFGNHLDMSGGSIKDVAQIDFSDADNWLINISGGDYRLTENGAVRWRIRDDDNNGYFEWFGTSGTALMVIDGDDLAVRGGIRAGSVAANITNGYYYHIPATTGIASNMHTAVASGSTYYILRSTSARKYKKHISYNKQAMLADIELRPATFWRDDDQEWFIGYIADDLAEVDYRLATYVGKDGAAMDGRPRPPGKDGVTIPPESPTGKDFRGKHVPFNSDDVPEPDNVQTLAVLAVLGAKANRSDDRWAEQEARIEALEDALRRLGEKG